MPLEDFQQALDALRDGRLDAAGLCKRLRAAALPPQLPPQYGEVLGGLLDRLESGALFGGESCSFSQDELVASLQVWIDKARERLAA
ncbi:MAG TPA: hypothetical protein VM326_01775 [Sphingomicrobium sp.]|nr:hypothetical protein [Sphingomicrobium sp.]